MGGGAGGQLSVNASRRSRPACSAPAWRGIARRATPRIEFERRCTGLASRHPVPGAAHGIREQLPPRSRRARHLHATQWQVRGLLPACRQTSVSHRRIRDRRGATPARGADRSRSGRRRIASVDSLELICRRSDTNPTQHGRSLVHRCMSTPLETGHRALTHRPEAGATSAPVETTADRPLRASAGAAGDARNRTGSRRPHRPPCGSRGGDLRARGAPVD
jgi:hypothetical protein